MATIITKNKTSSGTPSSLAQGELAVNIADKKMFVGGSGGSSVVDLEFEKFTGQSTTDLTVEKTIPKLILDNNINQINTNEIGRIQWSGQSSVDTFDNVGSIRMQSAFTFTSLPYTNMLFYTQVGSAENLVARFEDGGEVFFPDVYSDAIAGSIRDLYIKDNGQLGWQVSLRESKTNIQDLTSTSWVYDLNPVSFNYREEEVTRNEDGSKVKSYLNTHHSELEYGLIAEDVVGINDELVSYDTGGRLAGVHYKKLIVPMLKTIQDQKELIDVLTARVTALENA